FSVSSSLPVA
ncbi:hypothetical protein D049_1283B, partial [Vibrio parahaemolyticus VPTS-2010]